MSGKREAGDKKDRQLRRPFEGRNDEEVFTARLDGDDPFWVRRDGDADRRPELAVDSETTQLPLQCDFRTQLNQST